MISALQTLVAVFSALFHTTLYARIFDLKRGEWLRYFKKSVNLALCYKTFSKGSSLYSSYRIGLAAFLSSSYDVVTDWCKEPKFKDIYLNLVKRQVNSQIFLLVKEMIEKDTLGNFGYDGLERGIISLRIIALYAGSTNYLSKMYDLDHLGYIMQITDDILDIEEDIEESKTNCLNTPNRNKYLEEYINFFAEGKADYLKRNSLIMKFVLSKSLVKAKELSTLSEFHYSVVQNM